MSDLPGRMDAGICPPGSKQRHPLMSELEQGVLDQSHDRRRIVLPLPARKGASVIFDQELVTRHGLSGVLGDHVANGEICPTQEFVRQHCPLAGALKFGEPDSALATGNGHGIIQQRAGSTSTIGQL